MSTPSEPRTVRWGFLSTAKIATKLARAVRRAPGNELVAVASRTADRAAAWAKEHAVGRAVGSYQALLEDAEIDAVYIPLPPSMHLEWTLKAAAAGKHVLCEKPLARDAAESREMAAACREHGVQLMDGVMWVHHDRTPAMRRHLESGELGPLRRVTAAFSFNWDVVPIDNIRLQPALAGGSLGDLGYYCVRAILWALGDLPERAFATARYFNDCDMNLSGLLWFAGDRVASFDCGFDTAYRKWFEVAGTRGSLVCDDFVVPWQEAAARYWLHGGTQETGSQSTTHAVDGCVQEVRMIEHFAEIVRTGRLDARCPDDAIRTMHVCDALAASARTGRVVEVASSV